MGRRDVMTTEQRAAFIEIAEREVGALCGLIRKQVAEQVRQGILFEIRDLDLNDRVREVEERLAHIERADFEVVVRRK